MKVIALIIMVLISLDQIVKYFIVEYVTKPIVIIENFFELRFVKNYGVSFSMLDGMTTIILIITCVSIIFLIWLLYNFDEKLYRIGLTMMIAGAIGNYIDRLFFGYVIDYLDFIIFGYDFPVFNIADILIVCGGIIVGIMVLIEEKRKNG